MGTILHIYKVEGKTTDKFIDENFTQRFIHLHAEGESHTIVIRAMDFAGKKLDTIKDEDEIVRVMKEVEESIPEEDRHKIGKFLSTGEEDGNNS